MQQVVVICWFYNYSLQFFRRLCNYKIVEHNKPALYMFIFMRYAKLTSNFQTYSHQYK